MFRPAVLAISLLAATMALGCSSNAEPATPSAAVGGTAATGVGTAPAGTAPARTAPVGAPQRLTVSVVARYPHDPRAFTEGLVLDRGELFESTGLEGASSVRRVALENGAVLQRHDVAAPFFGEGLAAVGDELIQLSWRSNIAIVYARTDLSERRRYAYPQEGWGLCYDGAALVQSDGTNVLYRRDPDTFAETARLEVTDGGQPVTQLNELECVGGDIYANVWQTARIARIDAGSGRVTGWIDATALLPEDGAADDVLNGIAYDPADGSFLLTGKRWSTLYRVRVVPAA